MRRWPRRLKQAERRYQAAHAAWQETNRRLNAGSGLHPLTTGERRLLAAADALCAEALDDVLMLHAAFLRSVHAGLFGDLKKCEQSTF